MIELGMADQIYNGIHSAALQHDPAEIGCRWDESEYYPMVYPPYYYWLVSPLSRFPVLTAARYWCLLNALGFSVGLTCLLIHFRRQLEGWANLLPLAALFPPALLSLNMGQKSGLLMLILTVCYLCCRRQRWFWGGLAFGMLAIKPHLAIVIALAMLGKRQFAFVSGAAIGPALGFAASWWLSPQACWGFAQVCGGALEYSDHAGYSLAAAQNLWGGIKLIYRGDGSLAGIVLLLALAAYVGLALRVCLRGRLDPASPRFQLQFAALVVGTILLSPHFYSYDLSVLLLPMILVGGAARADAHGSRDRSAPGAAAMAVQCQVGWIAVFFVLSGVSDRLSAMLNVPLAAILLVIWLGLLSRSARLEPRVVNAKRDVGPKHAGLIQSTA
jgi:hypothetical protein